MDTIKDIVKDLKDRLTSPFFGSFLISWLIINWEVPVMLLFYDKDLLIADGKASYIKAIRDLYTVWKCFVVPFCFALFYTFAYPTIRNYILLFINHQPFVGTFFQKATPN